MRSSLIDIAMEIGNQKFIIGEAILKITKELGWDVNHNKIGLTIPPNLELGDYGSPLPLLLGKSLKLNPLDVAERIREKVLPLLKVIVSEIIVSKPGYLNFRLSNDYLSQAPFYIHTIGNKWGGKINDPSKSKIVVEYSSPNIAKLMHVGHLRSTMIGHALDNLYRHLGYDVISDNHIGDWGTQFGKLLVAYRQWSSPDVVTNLTVSNLEELYVRFSKEAKVNPNLIDDARAEILKLQTGDSDSNRLWRTFCAASMKEFDRVYDMLRIKFDMVNGESFYEPMLPGVVQDALEKKIAVMSEGATIIPLDDEGLPPFLIRKKDGGFLYATSDLATIKWREENLRPDLVLYVVADQQELHFRQLFTAARKLGYGRSTKLVHVPFGLILGEDGKKMSTREGETVNATQFIQKAIMLAKNIVAEKNDTLSVSEIDSIATNIGISALVYNDLSRERTSTIKFEWGSMMNLKGSSAPYLLYTYVRMKGIMRKINDDNNEVPAVQGISVNEYEPAERRLLAAIVRFPEVLIEASESYQPHIILDYLNNLAGAFHNFYDHVPIISSPEPLRAKRLSLLQAAAATMLRGLSILGMRPVERM